MRRLTITSIQKQRSETGADWTVQIDNSQLRSILEEAHLNELHIVFGEDIRELKRNLPTTLEFWVSPDHPDGANGFDIVYASYKGRRNRYNKVVGFLRYQQVLGLPISSDLTFSESFMNELSNIPLSDIVEISFSHYRANRRKPDPYIDDFKDISSRLAWSSSQPFLTSAALRTRHLTYADLLKLRWWVSLPSRPPLIGFIEGLKKPETPLARTVVEREYADLNDLLSQAAPMLGKDLPTLKRVVPILRASLYGGGDKLARQGAVTELSAGRLLELIEQAEFEEFDVEAAGVPAQRLAPLMFEAVDDHIGLRNQRSNPPESAQVRGGARALRSQCDDLLKFSTLDNIIPRYKASLNRVRGVLNLLVEENADDSHLVELGVEIDYLSRRISNANSRELIELGDEFTGFMFQLKKYSTRFSVVERYEDDTRFNVPNSVGVAAADALKALSTHTTLLTLEASDRVQDVAAISSKDMDPAHAKGLAVSLGNFASEAGGEVLSSLAHSPAEAIKKGSGKLGEKAALELGKLLVRHAPQIYSVASHTGNDLLTLITSGIEKILR